jgi:hypothetical protein
VPAARAQPRPLGEQVGKLVQMREALRARSGRWAAAGRFTRADGYEYAVDVAQLMACMADAGEQNSYAALAARARAEFVVDDERSDPETAGSCSGGTASATRPTPAARPRRCGWPRRCGRGRRASTAADDRLLALKILAGYARHAAVEGGVWLIRNYFGFGKRHFATNSFLVDYDPDFVQAVAGETGDANLAEVARRSYEVVRRAVTPAGLVYDVIQPELKTMFPLLDVTTFSPNDVIQLGNAAGVARTVARGAPGVARGVLRFAADRLDTLRMYHYGRGGEAVNDEPPGINEYSTLARLAAALGDEAATAALVERACRCGTGT